MYLRCNRRIKDGKEHHIPTKAVLAEMRQSDPPVYYLVGTPKGRLTKLEQQLLSLPWQAVRPGVEVKLLAQEQELYVLVQSRDRIHKERAMRRRQLRALVKRLKELQQMKLSSMQTVAQTGRRQGTVSGRLAADRYRDARVLGFKLLVSAQSAKASSGAPARRTLFTAQQYLRQRTG